jgi:hypothetical protein
MRDVFKSVAVKAPGFGDRRKAMLGDLAILTGGQVISEEASHLGRLKTADDHYEQLVEAPTGTTASHGHQVPTGPCTGLAWALSGGPVCASGTA